MRRLLMLLAALTAIAIWRHTPPPLQHTAGVLSAEAPLQQELSAPASKIDRNGFSLTPLAHLSLNARVLSRADYSWDTESKLAPVDLALGWGRMSDSAVLDKIELSQSGRFYYWHVNEFPIPQQEIIESSANMHLIPADASVERAIKRVRQGDLVSMDGFLVEVLRDGDGWRWRSSLTRSDTGAGACELLYVEHFEIGSR